MPWEHSSTRLLVDQRTDPTSETFLLLLGLVLFHALATIAAVAVFWAVTAAGISHERKAGRILFFAALFPAVAAGLIFRKHVKARPTPGFTSQAALFFTVTNFICGIVATSLWPNSLSDLPPLVPIQKWGLLFAAGTLSWVLSAVGFHAATRGKRKTGTPSST